MSVEDIVAEDQTARIFTDEVFTDDEGLGQPIWTRLFCIAEVHTPTGAVVQQSFEMRQIMGCTDDQDVAYAGQKKDRKGIVDHRLVVNGEHLLADGFG